MELVAKSGRNRDKSTPALVADHQGIDNACSPRRHIKSSDSERRVMEAQHVHGVYAPFVNCAIRVSCKLVVVSLGKDEQLGERKAGVNKMITSVRQQ